jgi:glycosyltransferase involved in cell wall biosynthesis
MAVAPLVTVITATYNGERTLPYTLSSALNQDFSDFEMWVVGDGCSDGSADVVTSFDDPRLKWTNLPQNTGSQSEPNNEGLRRARGRYIAFLGHDDLWFPWHLSALLELITAESADFVHALCVFIGPHGRLMAIGAPPPGETYEKHFCPPSSWLHRRELVERVGYWKPPETLSRPIDYDMTRRAYDAGLRFAAGTRPGVLKFPSPWWRAYAADSEIPQAAYAQAILADPSKLAADVMLELGVAAYREEAYADSPAAQPDSLFGRSTRRMLDFYGRDRWPVGPILRRRYGRVREERDKTRGL